MISSPSTALLGPSLEARASWTTSGWRARTVPTETSASKPAAGYEEGDALDRQRVRLFEMQQAFHLLRQALDELSETRAAPSNVQVPSLSGVAVSSVEAPQGELIYLVEMERGRIVRVKAAHRLVPQPCLVPPVLPG